MTSTLYKWRNGSYSYSTLCSPSLLPRKLFTAPLDFVFIIVCQTISLYHENQRRHLFLLSSLFMVQVLQRRATSSSVRVYLLHMQIMISGECILAVNIYAHNTKTLNSLILLRINCGSRIRVEMHADTFCVHRKNENGNESEIGKIGFI